MGFKEKIKECREKAGLTQEELAEKMGVQRNTVWRWENERANLRAENIQKLSSIFNVAPVDLIDDDTTELKLSSNLSNMKVPTKVILSTTPSNEISGRLVVKDGDFYVNLPDTSDGYSALLKIISLRSSSTEVAKEL